MAPDGEELGLEPEGARDMGGSGGDEGSGGTRRRRKRGSRGGRQRGPKKPAGAVPIELIPGDDDELPELADLPEDAVLVGAQAPARARTPRGRRGRDEREKDEKDDEDDDDEDDEDDEDVAPRRSEPHKKRVILVNARDSEEKRVAVVEEGRIVDLQMTVKKHVSYVNDIYRGRVVNIESAIGAAFVDFGEGRNGFLHASDVLPSYGEPDWNLEKLLSTPVADGEGESESNSEGWTEDEGADASEDGQESLEDQALDPDHDHESGPEQHEHELGEAASDAGEEGEEQEEAESFQRPRRGGRRARPARHRVRLPIDTLLKKGQMVAVQITKDAIGDKGPTLTTYISIPGRYLVLMPSLERTGVSRKIDDERERRRLKRILQSLDIPEGMGVIVRTAGISRTKTEIKRDLDYLLLAWEDFSGKLRQGRNPAPLYQESDVAIRTMRDLFTPETESVIVDDPEVFQRMIEFTKRLMPEHIERVRLHEGERPLFHSHGVEQDFEKIFARRVELPSGGSIVIEQTEALVAIDVNSGRTREEGAEFEDIALKTNLEATPEIARQIRLRDLGGIIVLDYIDMMRVSSRKSVERATRDALKADRARAKIGRISQFGLLELTRQRLGPGLSKLVYDTCPRCRGSGRRRNASSRAQAIMRRLAAALALKGYTTVEVRTHPDAIEYLQKELHADMAKLQELSGREIKLLPVPEQVEDSVLHYQRADGREVRPGGRRRR
ncbi:MAG: Rne/Rng family ribonuclease [Planctomycetes bacterium]|nr:Rne/Rng family ribonuclease [Planctomycetota bacterium]